MDKMDTCEVCCNIMPRILLIDDDHILLRIYQTKLTKEGYSVSAVGDGTAALNELQQTSPDLILLDLMLPDMNGVDVIRAVRATERERRLPIIVLSNVYLSEETDAAMAAGADRVFAKSVTSPRTVVDAIRELINHQSCATTLPASAPRFVPVSPRSLENRLRHRRNPHFTGFGSAPRETARSSPGRVKSASIKKPGERFLL